MRVLLYVIGCRKVSTNIMAKAKNLFPEGRGTPFIWSRFKEEVNEQLLKINSIDSE